jgi:putative transport protein
MTNPPALAAASNQTETDLPALSYASTYPVALIFKILLVQGLIEIFRHLL